MNKPKMLVIGPARSGKDTFAQILSEHGYTYSSSSEYANELFIFDKLKDKYGYKTKEECFEDRFAHREEWRALICEYNKDDKARLAKDILANHDIYVGMRDKEEYEASKHLFQIVFWIHRPGFSKDNTLNIEYDSFTMRFVNNVYGICHFKQIINEKILPSII